MGRPSLALGAFLVVPAWIWTYFGGCGPRIGPILGGLSWIWTNLGAPDLDLGGTGLDLIFIWGTKPGLVPRVVRTFTWPILGGLTWIWTYFRGCRPEYGRIFGGTGLDLDLFWVCTWMWSAPPPHKPTPTPGGPAH